MATPKSMNLNVRVSGALSEFVSSNVGESGNYENVSEYVRDLIRRDKEKAEKAAFEIKKSELKLAFAQSESDYTALSADDVFARNAALHEK
ncbi:MAG: addiction module antitoxin [Proteobacteria bacterium]|nr:addiction module antitoxin [Pseudomonadota bacterium]